MARATRSKKDVCGGRERKRTRVERAADEPRGEREREEEGWAWMVGGWRDTVNRWEAINFGLECPIAPHFVQCKFTPDANHLALFDLFRRGSSNRETTLCVGDHSFSVMSILNATRTFLPRADKKRSERCEEGTGVISQGIKMLKILLHVKRKGMPAPD